MAILLSVALCFPPERDALAATASEIQEWLDAHNDRRALHGVPAVTWSDTVATSAQTWADACPSSHSGSQYGENLAFATYLLSPTEVVELWYSEEPLYDYDNPGWDPAYGHFTQVVWKNTLQIGCGYRTGCSTGWPNVWVCQYNPPGNYLGQFANNVLPPIETPACPQCPGDSVVIENTTFASGTECHCEAIISIRIGPGVTVESNAVVAFEAPAVSIVQGSRFNMGSNVQIK
jgi:hypothetical protein